MSGEGHDPLTPIDSSNSTCGVRILVVENEPPRRNGILRNLKLWGYEAIEASGEGIEILNDAIQKARKHRCQLAIVDMRLLDNSDKGDWSGLELVPNLLPTRSIMISSYADIATAIKAIKKHGAWDFLQVKDPFDQVGFVEKTQAPHFLLQAIKTALSDTCRCALIVEWPEGYEPPELLTRLELESVDPQRDESNCLIRQLYILRDDQQPEVMKVTLQLIDGHSPSISHITPPSRSLVFRAKPWGQGDSVGPLVPHKEEIVKVASSERINDEIRNYNRYVKPFIDSHRTANIENTTAVLWNIGAIRYTDIATAGRKPLSHWYHAHNVDAEKVVQALGDLFTDTLRSWYLRDLDPLTGYESIYDYYRKTFPHLGERMDKLGEGRPARTTIGQFKYMFDPVVWVKEHRKPRVEGDGLRCKNVHGDLHGDNVYVNMHGDTYIIDFERCGPGYYLRDFVELEMDVLLRLLHLNSDELPLFAHLVKLLLLPSSPNERLVWSPPNWTVSASAIDKVKKAFDVVTGLRALARGFAQLESMEEYYWALLMEALISVVRDYSDWKHQEAASLAVDRSRLVASFICARLSSWGKPWITTV